MPSQPILCIMCGEVAETVRVIRPLSNISVVCKHCRKLWKQLRKENESRQCCMCGDIVPQGDFMTQTRFPVMDRPENPMAMACKECHEKRERGRS